MLLNAGRDDALAIASPRRVYIDRPAHTLLELRRNDDARAALRDDHARLARPDPLPAQVRPAVAEGLERAPLPFSVGRFDRRLAFVARARNGRPWRGGAGSHGNRFFRRPRTGAVAVGR